jgi:hypothetical protein
VAACLLLASGCGAKKETAPAKPEAKETPAKPAGQAKAAEGAKPTAKATSECGGPIPDNLRGQAAAEVLMAKWKKKNPDVDWEAEERLSRTFIPAADNSHLLKQDSQKATHPYRNFSKLDLLTWKRETERLVVAGSKVFHDANELGSTIAVSCDMCHPNAANTHPETYPKFQTQIGKVVLLRDMINWCLEQAARAPRMSADDPRMRAMEAYIISQRSGTKLEYGKH